MGQIVMAAVSAADAALDAGALARAGESRRLTSIGAAGHAAQKRCFRPRVTPRYSISSSFN